MLCEEVCSILKVDDNFGIASHAECAFLSLVGGSRLPKLRVFSHVLVAVDRGLNLSYKGFELTGCLVVPS